LANKMMSLLEYISDKAYRGYFVDLYVRLDNKIAIDLYERIGYSVYRRVQGYYGSLSPDSVSQEEDAYDMRKPLSRDVHRRSVRANGRNVLVSASQVS
ncbi:hypothetical protein EXIGLDRAFT_619536, partial [Exidia glandulosa HHB12029]